MLKLSFKSEPRFIEAMREKGPRIISVIASKLNSLMFMLSTKIATERLSGQTLGVKTGMLRGSIRAVPVRAEGAKLIGEVLAGGGPVMYAGVQEFGGTHPYDIVATKGRALSFLLNGKQTFASRVSRKPLVARPYMEPALQEFGPTIVSELNAAIDKVIKQ
jgi:hypothetical protein